MTSYQYTSKDIQRFWSKVNHTQNPDECWEWRASRIPKGYGHIGFGSKPKMMLSHRVAWELIYGSIPDGLQVLHKCDNPPCCNPNHLFIGTNQDNVDDKINKGRLRTANGDSHPNHKLNAEQIQSIRDRYKLGGISIRKLAKEFGIGSSQVFRIVKREVWKHLK